MCRDRFGEKPLYLFREEGGIFFGSEIKFLAALRGRPFDVNDAHLDRYLVNGYKSLYKSGETFFRGVRELPPGTVLRIGAAGEETSGPYWEPRFATDESLTYPQAVELVREALIRSVRLRLRADVPLAFCMSGGVDSNALISTAKRVCDYDVHGFTVMSDDARYEEREQIEAAVRELGIRHTPDPHHRRPLSREPGRARAAARRAGLHDQLLPALVVDVRSRHGRLPHRHQRDRRRRAVHRLLRSPQSLSCTTCGACPSSSRPWPRGKHTLRPLCEIRICRIRGFYFENPGIRDHIYLDAASLPAICGTTGSRPSARPTTPPRCCETAWLNELFHEAVPVILHEDDLNAMYFSIENRSPFLDRRLFEHLPAASRRAI